MSTFQPPILGRVKDSADGLVRTPPTLEDYPHLRTASGLTPKSAAQGQGALVGSWRWSIVQHEGRAVAMGRVIGDGAWYFHIADMATLPEHQGRGLGRRVLADLLAQIDEAAPAEPYVTLMADAPGRRLYESMGFVETAPKSVGMRLAHSSVEQLSQT
jgi:GNAT superfamily N-acetyltransferase